MWNGLHLLFFTLVVAYFCVIAMRAADLENRGFSKAQAATGALIWPYSLYRAARKENWRFSYTGLRREWRLLIARLDQL